MIVNYLGELNFRARFTIDDVEYLIGFRDYDERGRAKMTEMVYTIISGGSEGLAAITPIYN